MKLREFLHMAEFNRLNIIVPDTNRSYDYYSGHAEDMEYVLGCYGELTVIEIRAMYDPYAMQVVLE